MALILCLEGPMISSIALHWVEAKVYNHTLCHPKSERDVSLLKGAGGVVSGDK